MTTALSIITDALRESNIIPLGATPNAAQEEEAFRRLKNVIDSALGTDIGHPITDWPVGVEDYQESMSGWASAHWSLPAANTRLVLNLAAADTIYFPFNPANGSRIGLIDRAGNLATYNLTLNGNGRNIEGALTQVVATDNLAREWIYLAEQGNWVRVSELATTAEDMPFPARHDDYFIIKLAMRLNPRYGRALSQETLARLQEVTTTLQSEFRQKRKVGVDSGALSMNSRTPGPSIDPYNPPFGE